MYPEFAEIMANWSYISILPLYYQYTLSFVTQEEIKPYTILSSEQTFSVKAQNNCQQECKERAFMTAKVAVFFTSISRGGITIPKRISLPVSCKSWKKVEIVENIGLQKLLQSLGLVWYSVSL